MLNEEQERAVRTDDCSLLIVAGAGTGKTRVLVEKIMYLLRSGVRSDQLLALTFTNKASDEMRDRVRSSLSSSPPFIGTFHSLCVSLLREFFAEAGVFSQFTIFDRESCRRILKRCMKREGVDAVTPRVLQHTIGRLKTGLSSDSADTVTRYAEDLLPLYTASLEQERALDFDDLILKTISLLRGCGAVRESVRSRYTHILVDEFQDTDILQNTLVQLLSTTDTHVIAVGDTDQTIYSWRGACVGNMLSFAERYHPASTVLLTRNYRSTGTILSAANAVISKNTLRQEKALVTTRSDGDSIVILKGTDEEDEADLVVSEIVRLHGLGVPYRDVAVLFRANFQARALERHMLAHSVPYTVLGARFFDRAEIKGLVSYLMLVQHPDSREAFTRAASVPRRGIGVRSLERIFSGQEHLLSPGIALKVSSLRSDISHVSSFAERHTVAEVLRELVSVLDYISFLKNNFDNPEDRAREVRELIAFAERFSHLSGRDGIAQLLAEVALSGEQDTLRTDSKNTVRLMTIHAAKGLEFSRVFITGMEEGLFPFLHDEDGAHDPEEERRLCYVAMTRAKDVLYCSYARRRGIFGQFRDSRPSSFLKDIPDHLTAAGDDGAIQW